MRQGSSSVHSWAFGKNIRGATRTKASYRRQERR